MAVVTLVALDLRVAGGVFGGSGRIDEARTTTGDAQDAAFQGIGKYLLDNAWYAPWATPNVIYATNDTVSVQLSPGQIEPLIWDIKPID